LLTRQRAVSGSADGSLPRFIVSAATVKRALCVLLVACVAFGTTSPLRAAPSADERLLSLAQLWGDIRYFDPWLAYRNIDWDAAALAAIPEVANASSSEGFAVAYLIAAKCRKWPKHNNIGRPHRDSVYRA
jgi:hypothetical protein